jgi:phospholipase/carboxylesterase
MGVSGHEHVTVHAIDEYTMSATDMITRRRFGQIAGTAFASFALSSGCRGSEASLTTGGRIAARPRRETATTASGTRALGLGRTRDATLQIPARAGSQPLPLLVLLHGAGGTGAGILEYLGGVADTAGVAVLAPDSQESTWDAIRDDFGRDVDFMSRALEHVFERVAVDPARVSVGGFSDGATYALSLALLNGELFRHVLAFSPGFVIGGGTPQGKPRFFVSHGTSDPILPIRRCSRVIVPRLRQAGYEVVYREFEGGHEVPDVIAREGMQWIAGGQQKI